MKMRNLIVAIAVSASTVYGMGYVREWQTNKVYNPPSAPVTNVAPTPIPPPEPPVVVPTPTTHPFAGKRIATHRIAKDILDWKETANISASFKGNKLTTGGTVPKWPCFDVGGTSCQGNFALAVEQPDGSIVLGTWDWDRCGHQKVKSPGENLSSHGEHAFFNLRPGAKVWWFVTARSRDGQRTVKERSNFVADVWK